MDEISKSGQFRGPTPRHRDPTQQRKFKPRRGMSTPRRGREAGLDKPRVQQGVTKLRHDKGLRHGIATGHSMEILCFCFILFIRCFEDLSIILMRTL